MTDAAAPADASAGRLLREARERQGLHIAALAAAIKVQPKKLEWLEADRFDLLPDATFARALAQTVCRALKIDPLEVMRRLPPPSGHRLEQVAEGLNTPFRARPGAPVQRNWQSAARHPAAWLTVLILIVAAVVYFWPSAIGDGARTAARARPTLAPAETVAAAAAVQPAAMPASDAAAADATAAATPVGMAAASPADAASPGAATGSVVVSASAASWVEVSDARGQTLVGRLLQPGETVGLDGQAPFRVRIGNAGATRLVHRGLPVELQAYTRDNVARLELR